MSKQMLELAEKLEKQTRYVGMDTSELLTRAAEFIRSSAGSAQPVAFRWKHPNEPRWKFSEANPQYPDYSPDIVQPLYTRPAPSASVREALEPFANLVAFFNEKHRDTRPIIYGLDTVIAQRLTVGDLRRAATALAALSAPVPDRDADLPTANDVRGILGPAPVNLPQTGSAEPSPVRLAQALHEASVYGIGATSDTNQRVIMDAAKSLAALRTEPQASAVSVGCGDPNCSDPSCDYGKGPTRCQSCGAIIDTEPQTSASTACECGALCQDLGTSGGCRYGVVGEESTDQPSNAASFGNSPKEIQKRAMKIMSPQSQAESDGDKS